MALKTWRIVKEKYVKNAFDGKGASKYPGRWNVRGNSIVYTSENLALAALEILVNINNKKWIGQYFSICAEIPDDLSIKSLSQSDLDLIYPNWRDYPAPTELGEIGNQWLDSMETAILRVPSVVIPNESTNYLFNPNHIDFKRIIIHPASPFEFNPRILDQLNIDRSSFY